MSMFATMESGTMLFMARPRKASGKRSRKPSAQMFPPLVEAMLSPEFYPHRPRNVQLEQTHISSVYLAGDLVYKIKKPVDFGFLDYSTLRKRAYWCRREVELNRRLAPDLYLGISRIYRRQGRLSLEPPGRVVEYAVVMKRLPQDRLFSSLMARGRATLAQTRRIARRVADFHGAAAEAPPRSRGLGVLKKNIEENFRQTEPYIGKTVSGSDYQAVHDYNRDFLNRRLFLLRKRIRDGRIRDCHGDLHAEHICMVDGITIYDCIEFSTRLRHCDVAAETAFLYMDLLFHRHRHLARMFAEGGLLKDDAVMALPLAGQLKDLSDLGLDLYDTCRVLEIYQAAGKIIDLIDGVDLSEEMPEVDCNASGRGLGVIEAPRGILVHSYLIKQGCVERIRFLVATQFNNPFINLFVRDLAAGHVEGDRLSEEGERLIGRCIRTFDPCLSCATH